MVKNKEKFIPRLLIYLVGMALLAFGLTLNTKLTLGVSPIMSLPFSVSELSGFTFGDVTLIWYILFILVQLALHWKKGEKDKLLFDVLQFPLSLVFTRIMNAISAALPVYETAYAGSFWGSFWGRMVLLLAAVLLIGTGAALTLNMRLVPNPGDGVVQTVADFVDKPVGTIKNIFDFCCVIVTLCVSLLVAHKIIGIGVGTVVDMIGVGRVIAIINRFFGKTLQKYI